MGKVSPIQQICSGAIVNVFLMILVNPSSGASQGFWGSGENGYLFSGSWGALVIIFRELGSKLIV